ncbi:MAG TPA: MarR family transcriptional regulator [Nitrososphaeraceae archaeon]
MKKLLGKNSNTELDLTYFLIYIWLYDSNIKEREIIKTEVPSSTKEQDECVISVNSTDVSGHKLENDESNFLKNTDSDGEKIVQILIPKHPNFVGSSVSTEELHTNDKKILSLLSLDETSQYSFTGIKRKLNVHQQSLTRALTRLEDLGFVEKSLAGYRLKKNADTIQLFNANAKRLYSAFKSDEKVFQLLHARIPVRVDIEKILEGLRGKWFDKNRFIGSKRIDNGYMLKWLNETGPFELIVSLIGNYCIIDTNADSEEFKLQAMFGATRIVKEITKIVQGRLEGFKINALTGNKLGITEQMN